MIKSVAILGAGAVGSYVIWGLLKPEDIRLGVIAEGKRAVWELFGKTEMHFRATEYIMEEMWSKFRLNVCNNLPQAILGAGVGCYRDSGHMRAISDGLRHELEKVLLSKTLQAMVESEDVIREEMDAEE